MSLRTRKTLSALGQLAGALAVAWVPGFIYPGWRVDWNWRFQAFLIVGGLAFAAYQWWKYGASPRAVALRSKEEASLETRTTM